MNKYCVLLMALALPAIAADRIFTGSLERVGPASVAIRIADGLRVDAVLPAGFTVPYHVADQLEITCVPVKTVYLAETGIHYQLQLKNLRLVRAATAAAVPSDPKFELDRVRRVNLDYSEKLPNFVADEIARTYLSDEAGKPWRLTHTIEDEITVKEDSIGHQNVRRDGKPWKLPPVLPMASDFGLHLEMLFDPDCHTEIEFAGRQEADGKSMLVYSFRSPPGGCFWNIVLNRKRYTPGVTGRVLVDAAKGNLMRGEFESTGFPENFGADRYSAAESWDYVTVAGVSYLAPISTQFTLRGSNGAMHRATTEYKNHRHFEASTNVTFH